MYKSKNTTVLKFFSKVTYQYFKSSQIACEVYMCMGVGSTESFCYFSFSCIWVSGKDSKCLPIDLFGCAWTASACVLTNRFVWLWQSQMWIQWRFCGITINFKNEIHFLNIAITITIFNGRENGNKDWIMKWSPIHWFLQSGLMSSTPYLTGHHLISCLSHLSASSLEDKKMQQLSALRSDRHLAISWSENKQLSSNTIEIFFIWMMIKFSAVGTSRRIFLPSWTFE